MKIFYAFKKLFGVKEMPSQKVYFDGGFWGSHRGKRHGREIKIKYSFDWADSLWIIPSVYACHEGLVVDFCRQIEPNDIKNFMNKLDLENKRKFTKEERMKFEYESPFIFDFRADINVNGEVLQWKSGTSVTYNPCLPDEIMSKLEAKQAVERYKLDENYGWAIYRYCYPWTKKQKIRSFSVTMKQNTEQIPGEHFTVHGVGDTFNFKYNGTEHTLTVREFEHQTMDTSVFRRENTEYPKNLIGMSYTVTPEIPKGVLYLTDCVESDRPRMKEQNKFEPTSSGSIGIIGGADGPTAIIFGQDKESEFHSSFSSLHFNEIQSVEWLMIFNEKKFEDKLFSVK